MQPLPDSVKQLIDSRSFANVATLMPDGSPHVVMTWVDRDGDTILINTIVGSRKHRNAKRDSRVALTIIDMKNEFNTAVIRGRVKEVTTEGAEDHIDRMSKKYLGQDKYPMRGPGMNRVLIKIEPLRVVPPFTDTRPRKS
jgi:PPOX class probable F420-dependent enzyme